METSEKKEDGLRPLSQWLVSAAKAGYGEPTENGLGWRLPREFGACFLGERNQDGEFNLYAAAQEAALISSAAGGFSNHPKGLFVHFGGVSLFLPIPEAVMGGKPVRLVVVRKNEFPFPVVAELEPIRQSVELAALDFSTPCFLFCYR